MKKIGILLSAILFNSASLACINEYRTNLDGKIIHGDTRTGKVWFEAIDTAMIRLESKLLWKKYKSTDSIEYLSDYAAQLVYLGHYERAKDIYIDIENKNPGLYTTASNLGTIYELLGDPESALKWIQKSIEINPQSHNGSEWIHLKILEFQISNNNDYSNSILGLDFGSDPVPKNIQNLDLDKIESDIYYQLSERLKFVSAENETVGNIYFDYGNVVSHTKNVEAALESYNEAQKFGFESLLMHSRIAHFKSLAAGTEVWGDYYRLLKTHTVITLLILLAISVLAFFIIRFFVRSIRVS